MTEDFLHYLWKFQNFHAENLRTESGENLQIVRAGIHNDNSGPDFFDARIYIGDNLWAGNVEIHVKSSDWLRHGHQDDPAYTNVILHVVYEHDKDIYLDSGSIPTLQLKGRFDELQYWRYEQLVQNQTQIPCAVQFPYIEPVKKEAMLERVLVERLQEKAALIESFWQQNSNDWEETFYQWMLRGFGLKINADPMLMLSRAVPLSLIRRHADSLFQIESLLLGSSGILNSRSDEYSSAIHNEYNFLKSKYGLQELPKSIWKYSRLRPSSFPELRIAQFASIMHRSESLFSSVLQIGSAEVLNGLLSGKPSVYWQNHYRLGVKTTAASGRIGQSFRQVLIINLIVPFLFIYAQIKKESFYKQRALDILDQMSPENNRFTRLYQELGYKPASAFYSQALLQLNKAYCAPKKCLNCSLGIDLLKT